VNITIIANRYAKALFILAQEKNLIDQVYQDMLIVSDVFSKNKNLQRILSSPIYTPAKKLSLLKALFSKHISSFIFRFIELVLRKDRALIIGYIADSYIEIYKEFMNILTVELETAASIDEMTRIKVETNVENNKRSAKAIYLNESLNAVPIVDHRKVAAMA
jgi:F-type H+-transporting ATPase subunit delta